MAPYWLILVGLLGLVSTRCGTDAEGVSDCREIEDARCEAGAYCTDFRNVSACRRFQRDHCLHGLGVPGVAPGETEACVAELKSAGECARDMGPTADAEACGVSVVTSPSSICDVIQRPERAQACSFLVESPSNDDDD